MTLAVGLAAAVLGLYASAAYAGGHQGHQRGGGDDTEIKTSNSAEVSNEVIVIANTGANNARGGDAGRGADGGSGSGSVMAGISGISSNDGGNGGNGGRGGDGGTITTGAATAYGTIANDVNSNRIVVDGCGCDEEPVIRHHHPRPDNGDGDLEIKTRNRASVESEMMVLANTGANDVDGGDGSRGGEGGNGYGAWFTWFSMYSSNDGGNGGAGQAGGEGGTVRTGPAYSDGLVTNVVNRNVVRVTR